MDTFSVFKIKKIYFQSRRTNCSDDIQLAAAALMVEAAMIDGAFAKEERIQINDVLYHLFPLESEDIGKLIADAEEKIKHSSELYSFSRILKDKMDYDKRMELIQMLWEIVYSDGVLDDFEANLVRRVSGLLYITDVDNGKARKAALEQLGITIK